MTHNPLRSLPPVIIPDRPQPTKAQKARVWSRENGICYWCGKPVAPDGPGVQYDHRLMRGISADDSEDNLYAIHTTPCHAVKTGQHDAPLIAKAKRQEKLTGARVRKPGGFRSHPTLYRGLDGQVKERRR